MCLVRNLIGVCVSQILLDYKTKAIIHSWSSGDPDCPLPILAGLWVCGILDSPTYLLIGWDCTLGYVQLLELC